MPNWWDDLEPPKSAAPTAVPWWQELEDTRETTGGEFAGGLMAQGARGLMRASRDTLALAARAGTASVLDPVSGWLGLPKPGDVIERGLGEAFEPGMQGAEQMMPDAYRRELSNEILSRDAEGNLDVSAPTGEQLAGTVVESLPQLPGLLAGGQGAGQIIGRVAPKLATALGFGVSNAATVSQGQFFDTYQEVRDAELAKGATPEQAEATAQAAAEKAQAATAGLSFATGAAGMGLAGKLGQTASSPLAGAAKGFVADAPFEGVEEAGQSLISDVAAGREADPVKAGSAGLLGFAAGGVPGAAVGALESRPRTPLEAGAKAAEDALAEARARRPVTPAASPVADAEIDALLTKESGDGRAVTVAERLPQSVVEGGGDVRRESLVPAAGASENGDAAAAIAPAAQEVADAPVRPEPGKDQSVLRAAGRSASRIDFSDGNVSVAGTEGETAAVNGRGGAAGVAGLPSADGDIRRVADPETAAATAHRDRLQAIAARRGLDADTLAELEAAREPLPRDPVTGFYRPEERPKFVQRVIQHVADTGTPSHYVEADIRNLGGLNARLGVTEANKVYQALAQSLQQQLEATGAQVVPVRNGGDEISFTVVGAEDAQIDAALENADRQAQDFIAQRGLSDVPHPKGSAAGTGFVAHAARIRPDHTLDSLFGEVDRTVESKKKAIADGYGTRSTARPRPDDTGAAAGVVPSEPLGGVAGDRAQEPGSGGAAPQVASEEGLSDARFATAAAGRMAPDDGLARRVVPPRVGAGANEVRGASRSARPAVERGERAASEVGGELAGAAAAASPFGNARPEYGGVDLERGADTPSRVAPQSPANAGLNVSRVQRAVKQQFAGYANAPKVEVVDRPQNVTDERQRLTALDSEEDGGAVEGMYDPKSNTVHLFADRLTDPKRARWVAFHEITGHAGIRGVLDASGKGSGSFSRSLAQARTHPTIDALTKAVAADRDLGSNLDLATEEALAELSAADSTNDWQHIADRYGIEVPQRMRSGVRAAVLRFIDTLKRLFRLVDPSTESFSDADWRKLVEGARRYVRKKPKAEPKATEPQETEEAALASKAPRTQAQKDALTKAGLPVDERTTLERLKDKIGEQWQSLRDTIAGNVKQRVFDRFDRMRAIEADLGIKPEDSAYLSARLAAGLPSIMEGVMLYGAPEWQGGVLGQKAGTVGLLDALKPVEGDIDGWLGWMVGRRAKALKAQGREHLMSDTDIDALLSLANGKEAAFKEAALNYLKIKDAVLDVAEKAGLIDASSRATWDSVEYIPFYRADESDTTLGPGTRKALSNQSSGIRQLKGGTQNLADPLGNIVQNFTRLIDASLKNNAMLEAVDQYGSAFFEKVGMGGGFEKVPMSQVRQALLDRGVPQSTIDGMPPGALAGLQKMWAVKAPTDDDVVRVMRNGHPEYYHVPDPDLLASLTSFKVPTKHWLIKPFIFTKRLLTAGVTSSPEFMARNFIRDSGSAWVISDDKFRLGWDSVRGVIKPLVDDTDKRSMMFAGGSFIGGQIHGGSPDETAAALRRALRAKGLTSKQIEDHMVTVARTPLEVWDRWQKIGSALENANRNAVYEAAIKAGRSPKEAAYLARDLMDFAMQGDSRIVQSLSDILPFFNARLQGLYKLYRQGGKKALRKALLARAGTITATTMALLAWNLAMHAEGYDELEEWDRDTYWHIAPGTEYHIRIPKPFELGVLFATVPERVGMAILGKDRLDQTIKSLRTQVSGTLAMNPVPQGAMPLFELWANKSSFTGRPIENLGDEKLLPEARSEWYTSDTAKALSDWFGNATNLSPKRIEHLWNGYTGTMGAYALETTDWIVRQIGDGAERPELAWSEMPLLKAFYRGDMVPKSTRYTTEFYELLDKANEVSGTIKEFELAGRTEEASELEAKWAWLLGEREDSKRAKAGFMHTGVREFNKARDRLSAIRKEIEGIVAMPGFTDEEKRQQIEALALERNALAREITATYQSRR